MRGGKLTESRQPDDDGERAGSPPGRSRQNIAVVVIVVVLIAAGVWLSHVIANARRVQDCVLSGRTNCAPIETEPSAR